MSAQSIVERLRASETRENSHGLANDYLVNPDGPEAADTIEALRLAGMSVWNNLLHGDIEAHTKEAAASLELLHAAIAKSQAPISGEGGL